MKNKTDTHQNRKGMTLVELVVFMSLTFLVLGGVIPATTQSSRLDRASEEKMAALFLGKSVLEELHQVDFAKLTESGSGFNRVGGGSSTIWKRERPNVPFFKQGGLLSTQITANELTVLDYGSTGGSKNCAVSVTIGWNRVGGHSGRISETISTVLYP